MSDALTIAQPRPPRPTAPRYPRHPSCNKSVRPEWPTRQVPAACSITRCRRQTNRWTAPLHKASTPHLFSCNWTVGVVGLKIGTTFYVWVVPLIKVVRRSPYLLIRIRYHLFTLAVSDDVTTYAALCTTFRSLIDRPNYIVIARAN